MQRRYDTEESRRLMNAVLDGREWDSWDLQLQRLEHSAGIRGRQEIRIVSARRRVVVSVYVSRKLEAIYVLGYFIERKGEPSEDQRARIREYVVEIESLEAL